MKTTVEQGMLGGMHATTTPASAGAQVWPGEMVTRAAALVAAYHGHRAFRMTLPLLVAALTVPLTRDAVLPMAIAVPVALLGTVPLTMAHRFPAVVLGTVLAANAVFILFGRLSWPVPAVVAWLLAVGLCPLLLPRRVASAALVLCEVVVFTAAVISTRANNTPWDATIAEALAVLVGWGIGESLRARRRAAAEHAAAAALMRDLRERDAVTRERAAIARELHDVVAHHVSMIAVQAATVPYGLPDLPETARAAFGDIAVQARVVLAELRTVLGVLREGSGTAEESPQPTLADVPGLVQRMRDVGGDVMLTTRGASRPLPDSVEVCGFRIVQESLTNAGRHAPGARVRVSLDYDEDALLIAVENSAARQTVTPSAAEAGPGTGGFGLVGMRERVVMLDGRIEAGPDSHGGFAVAVRLPAPAPPPVTVGTSRASGLPHPSSVCDART
jgi:signal transduction histidine kinase